MQFIIVNWFITFEEYTDEKEYFYNYPTRDGGDCSVSCYRDYVEFFGGV